MEEGDGPHHVPDLACLQMSDKMPTDFLRVKFGLFSEEFLNVVFTEIFLTSFPSGPDVGDRLEFGDGDECDRLGIP